MIWKYKQEINDDLAKQYPEINRVILQLLWQRGLTEQTRIDEFLYPDFSRDIHDPHLFRDMDKALDHFRCLKESGAKVAIFGDYDADGVTASAILSQVFKLLELNFIVYIPDRESEGYGLNKEALKKLASQDAKTVITVDCGISNYEEVRYAVEDLKMEVIITDHHQPGEKLPPALATIHCGLPGETYPFHHLSGGGTAYKLAQALLRADWSGLEKNKVEFHEKWLLDLVAISTVADMVPLLGENRTLVKYGLIVLNKTQRLGLQKLLEYAAAKERLDEQTIGWQIAPRLNAAGRLMHADKAYQLLVTENIEEAIMIASQLNVNNIERQKITEAIINQAIEQIRLEWHDQVPSQALVVVGENWTPGVLGLVAGKLSNRFYRPVFVLSRHRNAYVGSGRSINEYDITQLLRRKPEMMERFGGHSGACGLTVGVTQIEAFKDFISESTTVDLSKMDLQPTLAIDATLRLSEINWELQKVLESFGPYGMDNPEPVFALPNVLIQEVRPVGADNKHLRLLVGEGVKAKKVIAFGLGDRLSELKVGSSIDIACRIDVNEWNGNRELQIRAVDFNVKV
ncbi:MAG: single-stranded-DNA-specific exonuclease RecJ [Candidatus Komeilibacteria bacterium]|nr:single-stranded-DNA-specific exonuclease RecJ [Candidatus Komeilibacteria bacterium]